MISYQKLFKLLEQRNIKRTFLLGIMSSRTLAKMGDNKNIQTDTIDKICDLLDCQPADIMEYIRETNKEKPSIIDNYRNMFNAGLHVYDDMTDEEVKNNPPFSKAIIEKAKSTVKENIKK